jgi:hypothetical protein
MPEGNKKLYMWLCVGAATVIIGSIWAAFTRYNIAASFASIKSAKGDSWETIGLLRDGLKKDFRDIKGLIDQNMKATPAANNQSSTSTL